MTRLIVALVLAQAFPEGPGKDTFELVCNFCHPATFVQDQSLTKAEWQAKVTQMLQEEEVSQQEKDAIVGYLAQHFPKRVKINEAPAKELQAILEITEAQAAAIVASRRAKGALKSVDDLSRLPGFDTGKVQGIRNRILF